MCNIHVDLMCCVSMCVFVSGGHYPSMHVDMVRARESFDFLYAFYIVL